jgi:hypothetical protein
MSETRFSTKDECEKLDSFDYEKLLATREAIIQKIPSAVVGFNAIGELINVSAGILKVEKTNNEEVSAALDKWLTIEKLEFIKAIEEIDPTISFNLIATPNVGISHVNFQRASQLFAQKHGLGRRTNLAEYSPNDLTGSDHNRIKAVKLALVPNVFTSSLNCNDVAGLNQQLNSFKKEVDFIGVLSPLQFLANAETLYQNGKIESRNAISQTAVAHFDLPVVDIGTRKRPELTVPVSFIDGEYLHQMQVPINNSIYTKKIRIAVTD